MTPGRALESLVAVTIEGWDACGCGNPDCDLYRNPSTGDYEPFPRYLTNTRSLDRIRAWFDVDDEHLEHLERLLPVDICRLAVLFAYERVSTAPNHCSEKLD